MQKHDHRGSHVLSLPPPLPLHRLASTQDEVYAALRLDDATDLPHAERKRRIFERLLHLPRTKPTQVTVVIVGGTIRVFARQRAKRVRARPDLSLVLSQDCDSLLLGARDIRLNKEN